MNVHKLSKLIIPAIIVLTSIAADAQVKAPAVFDRPVFMTSETTPRMIYLKWFSKGNLPAPDFMPLRYEGDNPVEAAGVKAIMRSSDTTFYTFFDTSVLKTPRRNSLQYFIVQLDTNKRAGNSSSITLISPGVSGFWFTETKAAKDSKMLGINLEWRLSSNENVRSIEIIRSLHPDKDFTLLVSLPGTKNVYTDIEISPDRVYYYRLRAIPENQEQAVYSNLIFSSAYNPQPPAAPWLVRSERMRGGVFLQYSVSDAEAAGIRIFRNDGLTPELKVVSDLLRPNDSMLVNYYDTTRILSGLTTYIFGAKTESSSFVESGFSEYTYIRPVISEPPPVAANFTAYEEDGYVILNWEDLEKRYPAVAGYSISRREEDGSEHLLLPENSLLRINSFADTTARPGHLYMYSLSTVDMDENRSGAATFSLRTIKRVPLTPFALQAMASDEGIHLEWSAIQYEGLSGISIYRYERGKPAEKVSAAGADTTAYTDATVVSGVLYFYYLTTSNSDGVESEKSEEVSIRW